jgi:DNA/RNA-binding domain of Phe-tRNA-synthetase-like protein
VTETVLDGTTGVLFERQSVADLNVALERLDSLNWDGAAIRAHAETFRRERFVDAWRALLARLGVDPQHHVA